MQSKKEDNLSIRRLKPREIPAALFVYSRFGRDGVWAAACLEQLLVRGEVWGGFREGILVICGALCPSEDGNFQSRALAAACPARWQMMPVAALDGSAVAPFLNVLGARCVQLAPEEMWTAAIPVKSGESLLPGYLAAGYELCLVRPLYELRPHYLARRGTKRPAHCETCTFPARDCYQVSKALENGFVADKIFWREDMRWLELYRREIRQG